MCCNSMLQTTVALLKAVMKAKCAQNNFLKLSGLMLEPV